VIGGDHVNLKPDEFRRQLDGSSELCVGVAPLDCNIATFNIAQVANSRPERFSKGCGADSDTMGRRDVS
jgi:hypothetical protein